MTMDVGCLCHKLTMTRRQHDDERRLLAQGTLRGRRSP